MFCSSFFHSSMPVTFIFVLLLLNINALPIVKPKHIEPTPINLQIDFINNYFNIQQFLNELKLFCNGSLDFVKDSEGRSNIFLAKKDHGAPTTQRRIIPVEFLPDGLPIEMFVTVSFSRCTNKACELTQAQELVNFLNHPEALKRFQVRSMEAVVIKTGYSLWRFVIIIVFAVLTILSISACLIQLWLHYKIKWVSKTVRPMKVAESIEVELKTIQYIDDFEE